MPRTLRILSGGALHGLVTRLQAAFEKQNDCRIEGTYGAVGAMKDKLVAGAPCDLVILSQKLIDELAAQGRLAGTPRPVGVTKTGVALKEKHTPVSVSSPEKLQALLQSAPAIFFPDPAKATAGIHFYKVLQTLGLADDTSRLRTYPNGAMAMAALAQAPEADAVGCTQVTEILITSGVRLNGVLPPPYELATTYTGAVASNAQEPELAQALLDALTADGAAETRRKCGFE